MYIYNIYVYIFLCVRACVDVIWSIDKLKIVTIKTLQSGWCTQHHW